MSERSDKYNLKGKWFGELEVLDRDDEMIQKKKDEGVYHGQIYWKCKCHACGGYRSASTGQLMLGHTLHCGCKKGENQKVHGMAGTKEHQAWLDMRQKCYNPKNKSYNHVGGRGVTICEEWKDNFPEFYKWLISHTNGGAFYINLEKGAMEYSPETCTVILVDELVSPNKDTLPNRKVGKLTVKSYLCAKMTWSKMDYYWNCECDCGNKSVVKERHLLSHTITSCGCGLDEFKDMENFKLIYDKLIIIRRNMIERCYKPTVDKYSYYGGRGIRVCDAWVYNAEDFIRWAIKNGYEPGLSIERINYDKDYCPENCKWIPLAEQGGNRHNNVYFKLNGEIHYATEWARILNFERGPGIRRNIRKYLISLGAEEVQNPNLSK